MAQRKPYNPNTKYGRKKLREQAAKHYDSLSDEEKRSWNMNGCLIMLIILIVMFFILGPTGFLKWASH